MIEALTEELDIRRNRARVDDLPPTHGQEGGRTRRMLLHRQRRGDQKGQRSPNLDVDPPPDLAIEIEITNSLLDKLGIYAGIGVPELWRYRRRDR